MSLIWRDERLSKNGMRPTGPSLLLVSLAVSAGIINPSGIVDGLGTQRDDCRRSVRPAHGFARATV
ncbi:hypothetical protein Arad_1423 [Rhizobium rhizogenes K84]|uniref:Uncharacterized protein n=1 Tax=Rhizobium rhizogenes (strain K84 / ATCC BAA-868) TaxID=311403 RepID=B9JBF7_RHIR8|nr:hypothetical protein Arad_1423 [Rhizobium rhizogenes K84]